MASPWRPPTLETARLILRPFDEGDAEAVYAYASNPNMTRFTLWDTHRSIDDSLFFVRDYAQARYQEHVPEPLGIVRKGDPDRLVVGALGCFWTSKPDGVMELGYNVAEAYWGRGFATEAAARLLEHAFEQYAVHRIQARLVVENTASACVARKLGMTCEGTLRGSLLRRGRRQDVQMFSILRPEWEVRRVPSSNGR